VSASGEGKIKRAEIDEAVEGGGVGGLGEFLLEDGLVELGEGFGGIEQAVAAPIGEDFFGDQRLFDEHGEQCSGHAVAYGVADEEANVMLIKAHDIVKIATHITGGAEEAVKLHGADLRERFGEKILLDAGGEAEFFIDPLHVEAEGFVAAAEDIDFGIERVDFSLHLRDLIQHGDGERGAAPCARSGRRARLSGAIVISNQSHGGHVAFSAESLGAFREGLRIRQGESVPNIQTPPVLTNMQASVLFVGWAGWRLYV